MLRRPLLALVLLAAAGCSADDDTPAAAPSARVSTPPPVAGPAVPSDARACRAYQATMEPMITIIEDVTEARAQVPRVLLDVRLNTAARAVRTAATSGTAEVRPRMEATATTLEAARSKVVGGTEPSALGPELSAVQRANDTVVAVCATA